MTSAALPPLEFVQLPGLRMGFVQAGSPQQPAVLLLHGFPEFHYSWRYQIPALVNAGFRVIAPDQRGYNHTDKHGPYDVATLANDILHLHDALGITRSHVVGHDWGAPVAYEFAHRFPERLHKLAILNGPHLNAFVDHFKASRTQLRRSWYIFYFQLPWLPERALRSKDYAFLEGLLGRVPGVSSADVARYKHASSQPGALSAMLGWYRTVFRTTLRELVRPHIRNVPAETLVIWGMRDAALEYGVNATLQRYVPHLQTHQIATAGHWVQLQAADEVNDTLISFLRHGSLCFTVSGEVGAWGATPHFPPPNTVKYHETLSYCVAPEVIMNILVIGAHPDDELFAGGTIAKHAAEGHHVSLLVTTRGEGGNMGDPPLCTRAELGALREAECRACAAALGIRDVVFLPYRDPEIGPDHTLYHIDVTLDQFAGAIAAVVEQKRPDIILTHGLGGEYGHPQHIYTHQAVLAALQKRPELRPSELLTWCANYQGADADDRMINRDDPADLVLDVTPWLAQKRAGFEAHHTQLPVFTRSGRTLDEVVRPIESFRRIV